MPDFNPIEMDALFRKGVERHEFEYNPDAWALMDEKLDNKSRKRRILFFLLGLVFLITTVLSYTYLNSNKESAIKEIATETMVIPTNDEKEAIVNFANVIEKEANKDTNEPKTQTKIINEYISTDSKESSSNIGAQNSFQSENTGNLMGNEIVSIISQNKLILDEQQHQNNAFIHSNVELATNKNLEPSISKAEIEYLSFPSLVNRKFEMFDSGLTGLESFNLKPSQSSIALPLLNSSNRFSLTVYANPEWSSVGLFGESKVGWNFGAKIGYQFADRFEVNAGVGFSRKIYKGVGGEYNMKGGWFNDIEPMQMDAKCDIIEIPIGLSYHMNGFRNSGFFADLGINSYMLSSEWYGFDYNDALVRPERYIEVVEENKNTHLVGVGRFAIGYQKILSNKTALQVSPYIQFPLTGIGAGQVNLYSSGVQFAIKFNTQ